MTRAEAIDEAPHDFDVHTEICRNCGMPYYAMMEYPKLAFCSCANASAEYHRIIAEQGERE